MRTLVNSTFKKFYQWRYKRMQRFMQHPKEAQDRIFKKLIQTAQGTEWGKKYGYPSVKNAKDFRKSLPVQDYEAFKPYIVRMMEGEKDLLWSGRVKMFSKSSGTTNDKSKYIPVSSENFRDSHIRGSWDTMTLVYNQLPDCQVFYGKSFLMAGNHDRYPDNPETIYGDVSALMIRNMPKIALPFFEPDLDIVLRDDWESKIKLMAEVACREDVAPLIRMVGGVPTWIIVFFRHILEHSGKSNILEVWPNFELYIHGGVSMAPYREQFQHFLPSEQVNYFEVYNASEGYFATQPNIGEQDMLLLLNNGVYYEFLPMEEWHKDDPQAISLEDVELGKNYAIVISTNAGLWRYLIGDTVMFTSKTPYKIKITGRTKQFVNAFGEEVMVSNTDKALEEACHEMNAIVAEYTVAPVYFKGSGKGGHEWLIEFEKAPQDLDAFNILLDSKLQRINSDYEAKRYKNMALEQLRLRALPRGTFLNWLRSKGRYGNQSKVPRLSNNRQYIDEIITFLERPQV